MQSPSRRSFLKEAGVGIAAFALGSDPLPAGADKAASKPSVMAIAAHPGDAFFAMGAPVAAATHAGGTGTLLSLTLGEKGSRTVPPEQYGAAQREASIKAASGIGARAEFLAYPDGEIPAGEEAKLAVCDCIRRARPSIVITHWKGSLHKDHRACYRIVQDALFYAALPGISRKDPAHSVGRLFFSDNWEDAEGFVPDTYLDITQVFPLWVQACSAFPMWRGETGFRYNDYYSSLSVTRGCVSGFDHAIAWMSPEEQRVRHLSELG